MHRVRAHISSTAGHDDPVPFARRPQQAIPIWLRLVHQTRVRGFYRAQEGEGREHWARCCSRKGEPEAAFPSEFGALCWHVWSMRTRSVCSQPEPLHAPRRRKTVEEKNIF